MSRNGYYEEIVVAGFGGQGIILTGKLLAQTAMQSGKEVAYMPSYGAEVRGGTAKCMVIFSDESIASPLVSRPDSLIVMNKASLDKFGPDIKASGLLVLNSSLIESEPELPDGVEIVRIPADKLAIELGAARSANMVALGAYLGRRSILSVEAAVKCLPAVLAKRYHKTLPVNTKALMRGAEFAAGQP